MTAKELIEQADGIGNQVMLAALATQAAAEARADTLADVLRVVDDIIDERVAMASTLNQTMQALSDLRSRIEALKKNLPDTLITEEWLLEVGFKEIPDDLYPESNVAFKRGDIQIYNHNDTGNWLWVDFDDVCMHYRHDVMALIQWAELKRDYNRDLKNNPLPRITQTENNHEAKKQNRAIQEDQRKKDRRHRELRDGRTDLYRGS